MKGVRERIRGLLGLGNMAEEELRIETERTPWDITFLRQAIEAADRSHDAETKCGCVLTKDNTILSAGYNGFVRDIDDTVLPNCRPHKYPFMLHAEWNAILNCARQGKSTLGATCYVTTKPCFLCFQSLWQAGISRIVYTDWNISKNYNHSEANDQIEALMWLINQQGEHRWTIKNDMMTWMVEPRLYLEFIPKNDVLPNNKVDKP